MHTRSWLAASAWVIAALGCRDDTTAPTEAASQRLPAAVAAAGALPFYQLSGGEAQYTCAVTPDSRAYCWGGTSLRSWAMARQPTG